MRKGRQMMYILQNKRFKNAYFCYFNFQFPEAKAYTSTLHFIIYGFIGGFLRE